MNLKFSECSNSLLKRLILVSQNLNWNFQPVLGFPHSTQIRDSSFMNFVRASPSSTQVIYTFYWNICLMNLILRVYKCWEDDPTMSLHLSSWSVPKEVWHGLAWASQVFICDSTEQPKRKHIQEHENLEIWFRNYHPNKL